MEWGMHKYTLLEKIKEIEQCLDYELWQSALALALTIPDICGLVEYSDSQMKGKVKSRYTGWFKKHVENYFTQYNTDRGSYFTADMCYALRNAFLHSGSDNIQNKTVYKFDLRVNSCNSYGIDDNSNLTHVVIDVGELCHNICHAARAFYITCDNKDAFEDNECNWLDIKEWSECLYSTQNTRKEGN